MKRPYKGYKGESINATRALIITLSNSYGIESIDICSFHSAKNPGTFFFLLNFFLNYFTARRHTHFHTKNVSS